MHSCPHRRTSKQVAPCAGHCQLQSPDSGPKAGNTARPPAMTTPPAGVWPVPWPQSNATTGPAHSQGWPGLNINDGIVVVEPRYYSYNQGSIYYSYYQGSIYYRYGTVWPAQYTVVTSRAPYTLVTTRAQYSVVTTRAQYTLASIRAQKTMVTTRAQLEYSTKVTTSAQYMLLPGRAQNTIVTATRAQIATLYTIVTTRAQYTKVMTRAQNCWRWSVAAVCRHCSAPSGSVAAVSSISAKARHISQRRSPHRVLWLGWAGHCPCQPGWGFLWWHKWYAFLLLCFLRR